jgi:hypothetical protein
LPWQLDAAAQDQVATMRYHSHAVMLVALLALVTASWRNVLAFS